MSSDLDVARRITVHVDGGRRLSDLDRQLRAPAAPHRVVPLGCVFAHGLQFDNVAKRVLRRASIYPRSSVSCAAVRLRTRFVV